MDDSDEPKIDSIAAFVARWNGGVPDTSLDMGAPKETRRAVCRLADAREEAFRAGIASGKVVEIRPGQEHFFRWKG